jgi:hypothetical protein
MRRRRDRGVAMFEWVVLILTIAIPFAWMSVRLGDQLVKRYEVFEWQSSIPLP